MGVPGKVFVFVCLVFLSGFLSYDAFAGKECSDGYSKCIDAMGDPASSDIENGHMKPGTAYYSAYAECQKKNTECEFGPKKEETAPSKPSLRPFPQIPTLPGNASADDFLTGRVKDRLQQLRNRYGDPVGEVGGGSGQSPGGVAKASPAKTLRENFRENVRAALGDADNEKTARIALAHGRGLRMLNRFRSAIARLDHILGRLESRIEKLESKGIDMSSAIPSVEEAKNMSLENKEKVEELKITYELLLFGESAGMIAEDARALAAELKTEIENLHAKLREIAASGSMHGRPDR